MKPVNANRQPFKCNHFEGPIPLWWSNPARARQPDHPFHPSTFFIHEFSGAVDIFQAHLPLGSSRPIRARSWAGLPVSRGCQRKGQPSLSQQRTSLPVPRPRQCVHKNLHNSSRKCQYTAIRRSQHYSCPPRRDLDELRENRLLANKRGKWWITPFCSGDNHTHRSRQ